MKRYINFPNIIYFLLICFIFNCYMLIKQIPLLLVVIIPLFLLLNVIPGAKLQGAKRLTLKICNHGTAVFS